MNEKEFQNKKKVARVGPKLGFYFLFIIAISDTFGGLTQDYLPLSQLLRAVMFIYLITYIVVASVKLELKVVVLSLIFYLTIRVFIDYLILLDEYALFMELGSTLKLIYFPLIAVFIQSELIRARLNKNKVKFLISFYGWLILASLFLGYVTGLGGEISGRGTLIEAGKGFMIGANEVGLMLLMTAPFVGYDLTLRTGSTVLGSISQLIIYVVSGFYVFTKSSLVAMLTSTFSVYLRLTSYKKIIKWLIRIIIYILSIFTAIFIFKNLELIKFFINKTFFSALIDDGLVMFIFRGRQDYIEAIYPELIKNNFNWVFILFGSGEYFVREISLSSLSLMKGEGSMFEMDLFDFIAAYGICGFLILSIVIFTYIKNVKFIKIPIIIKIIFIFVLMHSFLAGHVIFSPQVTTILVLITSYYQFNKKLFN
jgi:hypothetical protein